MNCNRPFLKKGRQKPLFLLQVSAVIQLVLKMFQVWRNLSQKSKVKKNLQKLERKGMTKMNILKLTMEFGWKLFLGSECTAMKPLFCKKNEIKHLRSSCRIFRFKDLKLRSIFLFQGLGTFISKISAQGLERFISKFLPKI